MPSSLPPGSLEAACAIVVVLATWLLRWKRHGTSRVTAWGVVQALLAGFCLPWVLLMVSFPFLSTRPVVPPQYIFAGGVAILYALCLAIWVSVDGSG